MEEKRDTIAEQNDRILDGLPRSYLRNMGVELEAFKASRAEAIRDSFGIKGPLGLEVSASFRKSKDDIGPEGRALVILTAAVGCQVESPDFDAEELRRRIPELRAITAREDFPLKEMAEILRPAGVILVAAPAMPGSGLQGSSLMMEERRVIILITDRRKRVDTFYFTLFHELAHILRGEFENVESGAEDRADALATGLLFPGDEYEKFKEKGSFKTKDILEVAQKIGIDPALVLGRLQKEKLVEYSSRIGDFFVRSLHLTGIYPTHEAALVEPPKKDYRDLLEFI